MIKRFGLLIVCCWMSIVVSRAQTNTLQEFNQTRLAKQKSAMVVLGSWALGNIAVGSIGASQTTGNRQAFHQMNVGWNVVNLTIAGLGYWGAHRTNISNMNVYNSIEEHHKMQKVLLFNAGLDIGYMLGGAYLVERSRNLSADQNPERIKGFGQSILLQGGFLFAFDLITYFSIASDNKMIQPLLGGQQAGVVLRF